MLVSNFKPVLLKQHYTHVQYIGLASESDIVRRNARFFFFFYFISGPTFCLSLCLLGFCFVVFSRFFLYRERFNVNVILFIDNRALPLPYYMYMYVCTSVIVTISLSFYIYNYSLYLFTLFLVL